MAKASLPKKITPEKKSGLIAVAPVSGPCTAAAFRKQLLQFKSAAALQKHHRYFDFDETDPNAQLRFAGVRMGQVFEVAKAYRSMPVAELAKLLDDPIYEFRAGACSIMGKQAEAKNSTEKELQQLVQLYLRKHDGINHWGLVDLAAHKVIGRYLYEYAKPRDLLYELAASKNPMKRRSAIVATLYLIPRNDLQDAVKLATLLLHDQAETVNRAVGWALRELGKANLNVLLQLLDKHATRMPRITLRYALEKLPAAKRKAYLEKKKA